MGTGVQTGVWLDMRTDLVRTGWGPLGSLGRRLGEAQTPTGPGTRCVGAKAETQREPVEQKTHRAEKGQHRGEGSWEPPRGRQRGAQKGKGLSPETGGELSGALGPQPEGGGRERRGVRETQAGGAGTGAGRCGTAHPCPALPAREGRRFRPAPSAPTPPAGGGRQVAAPAATAVSQAGAAAAGRSWLCGGRAGG